MHLYDYGMFWIAAPTLHAARDILQEEHGPRGPLRRIADDEMVSMTYDGETNHKVSAAQVASENGPGIVPEW
jgi:hypothetical protein